MGKIVAAIATVHAPQLFFRPPSEDPAQLDADIAAMRQLGKDLDEIKPDAAIVIGNDHLETFFLTSVPTFAIMAGERARAEYGGKTTTCPCTRASPKTCCDKLMLAGFDMAYSQDAVLGHSFAAVYEWVIEKRPIPVVPIFVNAYLPPLPTARRCEALGKAIAKIIAERPERVAIIASGGMSHFPGTWKYAKPDYDFDYWAIAQMEKGNYEPLLNMTNEQFDRGWQYRAAALDGFVRRDRQSAGGTDHLPAHLASRPRRPALPAGQAHRQALKEAAQAPATYTFKDSGGYEFYKHPSPSAYKLNKVLYDLRFKYDLRMRILTDLPSVAEGIQPERRGNEGPRNASDRRHRALQERHRPSAGQNGRAPAGHVDERASDALRIAQAAGRRREIRQRESSAYDLNPQASARRRLSRAS